MEVWKECVMSPFHLPHIQLLQHHTHHLQMVHRANLCALDVGTFYSILLEPPLSVVRFVMQSLLCHLLAQKWPSWFVEDATPYSCISAEQRVYNVLAATLKSGGACQLWELQDAVNVSIWSKICEMCRRALPNRNSTTKNYHTPHKAGYYNATTLVLQSHSSFPPRLHLSVRTERPASHMYRRARLELKCKEPNSRTEQLT
ncbi:lsd one like 1 [Prunus dulcis]|uniref:Lsd one like 1 n=1 Tax=Prunus dulcis TaxID=3755 RepID=A0A4Y1RG27_PRUDU|nr:lsd one like 1 [Prunus dulcis]